jgi:hypothetical protein
MDGDRFELEGAVYYQQGRKCGRSGCKCARGDLHGPYWYRREVLTGKVVYLGRTLAPEVTSARQCHDLLLTAMVSERWALIRKADALARLIGNKALSNGDREIIEALGFGAALVLPVAHLVTQDDGASCVTAFEDPETSAQEGA